LLFGWVRAWRGGVGAAIALHAMSNLYSEILARSWL
jgi:membrane protease YdiL (CAAX protease family)